MAVTKTDFDKQIAVIKNGRGEEIDIALVKALEMLWEYATPAEETTEVVQQGES